MQKKGVDISEHNGSVDFQALKNAGVQFAILPYECTPSYRLYYQSPKIITPTSNVLTGQGFVPNTHVKTLYTFL